MPVELGPAGPRPVVADPQGERVGAVRRSRRRPSRRARAGARSSAPPARSGTRRGRPRRERRGVAAHGQAHRGAGGAGRLDSSSSWARPGCGARSGRRSASSRSTPSRRRISSSASRAVSPIASKWAPALVRQALGRQPRRLGLRLRSPRRGARRCRADRARSGRAPPSRPGPARVSAIARRVSSRSAIACPRSRRESPSASAATTTKSSSTFGEAGLVAAVRRDRVDEERERQQRDQRRR